jgi:hypothetical protein
MAQRLHFKLWIVLAAGLCLPLAACGDDDDGATTGETDGVTTAGTDTGTGTGTGDTAGATDASDTTDATDTTDTAATTDGETTDLVPLEFANAVSESDPRYPGMIQYLSDTWDTEQLDQWPPAEWMLSLMATEPDVFGNQYEKFGFIYDTGDQFPVGFKRGTADPTKVHETCAICHVSKLPDGRLWLGAPSTTLDFSRFRYEVDKRWTAANPANKPLFDSETERAKAVKLGPGRTDAASGSYPIAAPANLPVYFTLDDRKHLNYMGTGQNTRTEAYFAIFTFGAGDPNDKTAKVKFPAETRTAPMLSFFGTIDAPKGPAGDAAKIARGQEVFKQANCTACHTMKEEGGQLIPDISGDGVIPLDMEPTGKERLPGEDAAWPRGSIRTSYTHYQLLQGEGDPDVPTNPSGDDGRLDLLNFIIAKKLSVSQTDGYRTNDLRGLWATAPYLHNGSVPTLEDLLKPAAQRPTKFTVYGFDLDTTTKGNSNQGHEWGTDLPEADKQALVEFLKSL